VRAEAQGASPEAPETANEELENGPWEMTPPDDDSDSDVEYEEEESTGPISWLKNKLRRKSKEELEAEQAEKSAEVLEVCTTRRSHCLQFALTSPHLTEN